MRKPGTGRFRKSGALLVGAFLFFALLSGCDFLEKRRILAVLSDQAKALQKGNADAFLVAFAPDYDDPWIPFAEARAALANQLLKAPFPVLQVSDREVEIAGDRAVVTRNFTLEAKVEGQSRSRSEVEHLIFQRRGQGWVVVQGSVVLRLLGGQLEEEIAIEQVLLRREAALINQDLESMMSLISTRYSYKGNGSNELKENIFKPIFQVYDNIKFRSYDRKIFFFGAAATVEQSFTMQANLMGNPKTFSGQERFELENSKDGWKFTKGF